MGGEGGGGGHPCECARNVRVRCAGLLPRDPDPSCTPPLMAAPPEAHAGATPHMPVTCRLGARAAMRAKKDDNSCSLVVADGVTGLRDGDCAALERPRPTGGVKRTMRQWHGTGRFAAGHQLSSRQAQPLPKSSRSKAGNGAMLGAGILRGADVPAVREDNLKTNVRRWLPSQARNRDPATTHLNLGSGSVRNPEPPRATAIKQPHHKNEAEWDFESGCGSGRAHVCSGASVFSFHVCCQRAIASLHLAALHVLGLFGSVLP